MAVFLDGLTFTDYPQVIPVPGWPTPIRLLPFQVLLWISFSPSNAGQLPVGSPRLPVLLDPGTNFTLSLKEEHLNALRLPFPISWSNRPLQIRGASGVSWPVRRFLVDVWLHSNLPHLVGHPYPLRLAPTGVACYPLGGQVKGPAVPLLGLAALCAGSLKLEIECHPSGGTVRLHTP